MELINIYFDLFKNSFIASMLPSKTEWFFWIMKNFPMYNSFLIILISSLAGCLACISNYFMAYLVRLVSTRKKEDSEQWKNSERTFNKIGKYSLILACFPFAGIILSLISGRLKTDFKFFIITVFISKISYYCFFTLLD